MHQRILVALQATAAASRTLGLRVTARTPSGTSVDRVKLSHGTTVLQLSLQKLVRERGRQLEEGKEGRSTLRGREKLARATSTTIKRSVLEESILCPLLMASAPLMWLSISCAALRVLRPCWLYAVS